MKDWGRAWNTGTGLKHWGGHEALGMDMVRIKYDELALLLSLSLYIVEFKNHQLYWGSLLKDNEHKTVSM